MYRCNVGSKSIRSIDPSGAVINKNVLPELSQGLGACGAAGGISFRFLFTSVTETE